ncbi:hypothetical protein Taro_005282, partial [Colocasia esculenta]|nr:hypothetical protein [Colocasia esculenta]
VSIEHPSSLEPLPLGQGPTLSGLNSSCPSRGTSPVHSFVHSGPVNSGLDSSLESGLDSSLESGLGLGESSSSQPCVRKEKGRQVPARFVMALAEKCAKLSQVPEFLEDPTLVESDFEEGDSVDDSLGVYLLDFDEEGKLGDLGSGEEDPVSSYVDGTKSFDEPTMAADKPTKEVNLGTEESPKTTQDPKLKPYQELVGRVVRQFRKLTLVHTPRAQNILADSLASLASSIPIPLGKSSEIVSVQRLRVPSHVDPWFSQLVRPSPSLRVHALSKEPEIDLEDGHPWYFDIENFLKDGSFPYYATSADRWAIRRVSERYKIIGPCTYHNRGIYPWKYNRSPAPHSSLRSPSLGLYLRELLTSSSSLSRRWSGRGGLNAVDASGRCSPPRTTEGSPRDTMSSRKANADPVLEGVACWACRCCSRRFFSTRSFSIS